MIYKAVHEPCIIMWSDANPGNVKRSKTPPAAMQCPDCKAMISKWMKWWPPITLRREEPSEKDMNNE